MIGYGKYDNHRDWLIRFRTPTRPSPLHAESLWNEGTQSLNHRLVGLFVCMRDRVQGRLVVMA